MNNRSLSFQMIDPTDGKWWYLRGEQLTIGTWNYYTYTMDYTESGPLIKIYMDGNFIREGAVLYETLNQTMPLSMERMDTLVFGNFYTDVNHYNPNIEVDDVTIFEYSLDEEQVDLLNE